MNNQPNRCQNPECKRILSDRGKPNKSGFCSNCYTKSPKNKKRMIEYLKNYRILKKLEKNDNIKNKNNEK